jgi:hypothetical protein
MTPRARQVGAANAHKIKDIDRRLLDVERRLRRGLKQIDAVDTKLDAGMQQVRHVRAYRPHNQLVPTSHQPTSKHHHQHNLNHCPHAR